MKIEENQPLNVLLLCNYDAHNAATVCDHINSLAKDSRNNVTVISTLVASQGELPDDVDLDLFDAVIVHYSLFLAVDAYLSPKTKRRLAAFSGIKAIFLQDEYRFIDQSVKWIRALGFDIVFTCIPEESIEDVYPSSRLPDTVRINVLTGYVPKILTTYEPIPLKRRRYHLSYRGRKYPAWHGRLGLEKWHIAKGFLKAARGRRLSLNIKTRERSRVYGADWIKLIRQSRAVLGVESGASVFDFDGSVSANVDSVYALLDDKVDYDWARANYFAEMEDKYSIAQISPRIFEAIALRTLCVLFEGEYSGILKPWRHFVPLKKDFSNIDEVIDTLKDDKKCAEIIARAYAEIALNPEYSFQTFSEKVDNAIFDRFKSRNRGSDTPKTQSRIERTRRRNKIAEIEGKYGFFHIANPHSLKAPKSRKIAKRTIDWLMDTDVGARLKPALKSIRARFG